MSTGELHFVVEGLGLRAGAMVHGRVLFDGLSFAIEAGQRWVVLGPNGAGKSSLLAALAGVFRSSAGRICLQGRDIGSWRPEALADWRAWCPQFWTDPFPASVIETACLAAQRGAWWSADAVDEDAARQVLAELDLTSFAQADVRQLSGGERQRVAVATAMLQGAPLLLLDEPASHLDLAHQQLLLGVLMRHAAQRGAVVASLHDINLAWDLATHAVLIDGRGGVYAGPRDAVICAPLLTAAFGVAVDRVEVFGQTHFWVGPLGKDGA
jgi:iron complex transport system ATP-binding protein